MPYVITPWGRRATHSIISEAASACNQTLTFRSAVAPASSYTWTTGDTGNTGDTGRNTTVGGGSSGTQSLERKNDQREEVSDYADDTDCRHQLDLDAVAEPSRLASVVVPALGAGSVPDRPRASVDAVDLTAVVSGHVEEVRQFVVEQAQKKPSGRAAVSYTHLTLPTILRV